MDQDARNILNKKREEREKTHQEEQAHSRTPRRERERYSLGYKRTRYEDEGDSGPPRNNTPVLVNRGVLNFMTPFNREIMDVPNPGKIKVPSIEHY